MKRILLALIVLFSGLFSSKALYAISPAMGGEITYQYINDSTYRFYFRYYLACSSMLNVNKFSLCYRNNCSNIWQTKILEKTLLTPWGTPNGQPTDLGCANSPNTCNDPNSTKIMYREWWYSGIVTLNEPCDDWTFSVNVDERDRTFLTNLMIFPPFQHDLYIETTLKPLTQPKQSSPFFSVSAPVYASANSMFHGNLGVIDPDGDSLVYKLIQPRSATTDIFVICAGYPPYDMPFIGNQYNLTNNPLLTNNTFTLNSQTGDYSFTPTGTQAAYVAFKVEKYRNQQLIGTVMRDSRIMVDTNNTPPIVFNLNTASITGTTMSNDTIVVCGNTEVNFCYTAQTTTSGAKLVMKDNSSIALKGSRVNFQNQETANVTGCINWKPLMGDIGYKNLIVSVKDSTCGGNPVIQSFRIPIYVKPGTFAVAKDTIICPGSSTELYGFGGSSYNWTIHPEDTMSPVTCSSCDTAIVSPLAHSTRYILSSNLGNGCSTNDTVTVHVDYSTNIHITTPKPMVLCDGEAYIQLASQAGGSKPLKTIACGPFSPQCSGIMDSAQIAQTSSNSWGNNMVYNFNTYWGPFYVDQKTQKMQILYRKDELLSVGMKPGTIQKISLNYGTQFTGQVQTFNNVKISVRCTDKNVFTATAQSEFETGLTQVYSAPTLTLHGGWNDFDFSVPYDYDTSKNLVVQFCYTNVTPGLPFTPGGTPNADMLPIYYVYSDYKSSIWAGQAAAGDACANSIGSIHLDYRKPDTRFTFCELPRADFVYNWSPANGMDNPAAASTGVIADESKWYTVSTQGQYGCTVKDSIYVYVADNHFKVEPDSVEICEGEAVQLNVTGAYQALWFDNNYNTPTYMSCSDCPSPSIYPTPAGKYPFHIIASDSFGCSDTLNAVVIVKPVPATHILNNDTLIQYGQSVRLYVEGADAYLWTPVNYINDPRSPSPLVSPLESTLYIVTGYLNNGCVNADSVWVNVERNAVVLIPSAFSPNGDGLNDVFRIENLSFQKASTFRVFNRYGQVVYDGMSNNNKGWDGMFKGKLADQATYFYQIQLNYPDGKVEYYKGDVTLIR